MLNIKLIILIHIVLLKSYSSILWHALLFVVYSSKVSLVTIVLTFLGVRELSIVYSKLCNHFSGDGDFW